MESWQAMNPLVNHHSCNHCFQTQQDHLRRIIDKRNKKPRMINFCSMACPLEPNRIPKINKFSFFVFWGLWNWHIFLNFATSDPHPWRTPDFLRPMMAKKDTPNRNWNRSLKHKPFASAMEPNGTINYLCSTLRHHVLTSPRRPKSCHTFVEVESPPSKG